MSRCECKLLNLCKVVCAVEKLKQYDGANRSLAYAFWVSTIFPISSRGTSSSEQSEFPCHSYTAIILKEQWRTLGQVKDIPWHFCQYRAQVLVWTELTFEHFHSFWSDGLHVNGPTRLVLHLDSFEKILSDEVWVGSLPAHYQWKAINWCDETRTAKKFASAMVWFLTRWLVYTENLLKSWLKVCYFLARIWCHWFDVVP